MNLPPYSAAAIPQLIEHIQTISKGQVLGRVSTDRPTTPPHVQPITPAFLREWADYFHSEVIP